MAAIGQIIDGKYEILKEIGRGGMSIVYLAIDLRLNRQWAIKEVKKQLSETNDVRMESAIKEAEIMKDLDHPSIVRIVDIIYESDVIYIIEDYVEGLSLAQIIESEGPQKEEQVVAWGIQVAIALDYLHHRKTPIIYRDVKPSNVMLKPDGDIKMIDFGIARSYKEDNFKDTVNLGTRGYAAPEQFGGRGQTDVRTDIYSLGATLYHLITGKNPGEAPYMIKPIRYWNDHLTYGLETIIQKCTKQNPEERYQNCQDLIYALNHYRQYGKDYRMKIYKKLYIFFSMIISDIFFFICSSLCICLFFQLKDHNFDGCMINAAKATSQEDAINYYEQAIKIKPLDSIGYLNLINLIKKDGIYTLEEEKKLKKMIMPNIQKLQEKQKDYGLIAYEIGKLYWFYYEYGKLPLKDNKDVRMKSAASWFDDAIIYAREDASYVTTAKAYRDIGLFLNEISLQVVEASDQGQYAPYWEKLCELFEISKVDNNEMVKLEIYSLIINSIDSYSIKFKYDGLLKKNMENLYENVKNELFLVHTTTEKTSLLKKKICNQLDDVKTSIQSAYESR